MTVKAGINLAGLVGLIVGVALGVCTVLYIHGCDMEKQETEKKSYIMQRLIGKDSNLERVYTVEITVDGDEVPGIGADKIKPDTCLAYFDEIDKKVHIRYK